MKPLILTILILFLPLEGLAKNYYLKEANVEIKALESGLVKVTEKITYSFSGRFRFVERIIPLRDIFIENVSASVKGAAALFQKRVEQGKGIIITAYISEDPQNINKGVENKDITLIISYDIKGALKLFQDVAELFPKLWGEGWSKPLNLLKGEIELPKTISKEVKYWIHPKDYLKETRLEGNKLLLNFENIPSHQFIEIRLLMPKEWFVNAIFAKKYNYPALRKIEEIELSYERKSSLFMGLALLTAALSIFIPLVIYLKWGREPKVSYYAPYEHEPPYPDPPSFVNAIMMGKIGIPTLEGFIASILELIRKGFLEIENEKGSDIIIKIKKTNNEELNPPEKEILNFLKEELKNEGKGWKKLTEAWKNSTKFKDFFDLWKDIVTQELNPTRFFTATGSKLLKIYGSLAFFLGIILMAILTAGSQRMFYPKVWNLLMLSMGLLTISGIISFFLPEQVGGRWTPFGRVYSMRWKAFKRFLSDFSLLKMHPPTSIAIWDKYLVYATALGVAEETWKAMKFLIPRETIRESSFYPVWDFPTVWIGNLRSSLMDAYIVKTQDYTEKSIFSDFLGGSGGIGGIGRGFGGGGGRAG
ncbi:MAG: DUF2207 domain-containing protein [Synergistetes bacterium]|nr:DUF2207 domain-containing protein [Synergistota bacterium]